MKRVLEETARADNTGQRGTELPHIVARLLSLFARYTAQDSPKAYTICAITAVLLLTATAAAVISAGPIIQNRFGHDTPFLLEGAWKVYWGYKPHVDFYSHVADLHYLVFAAAFSIVGPTVRALPVGVCIFALGAAALAWSAGRPRLSAPLLLLFTLFTAFVAFSSHHLRLPLRDTTYSTLYNRHGYALLSVVALLLFVSARNPVAKRSLIDGLLVGAVCAALAFVKITFLLAAAGFVAVAAICWLPKRSWLAGFGLGLLAVGLPLLAYLNFDLSAIAQDLKIAAGGRSGSVSIVDGLRHLVGMRGELQLLAAMCLVTAVLELASRGGAQIRQLAWRSGLMAVAFVGCAVCIVLTNSPEGVFQEVPLLVSAAIFLVEYSGRTLPRRDEQSAPGLVSPWTLHIVNCCLALFLIADVFLRDVASVAYSTAAALIKVPAAPSAERIQGPSMSPLIFRGYAGDPPMPVTYAEKINDGLKLLEEHATPSSRIESFDFTNPFPFASLRPPNPGGAVAQQVGITFSANSHPAADRLLGHADVVMVPKFSGAVETTKTLLEIYREYLQQHFRTTAESDHWILLERNRS